MDNKQCIVPSLSALYALQNHVEGECVFCEEDNKIYSWQENDGWKALDIENQGISLNLYDLNKTIINQLSPMTIEEIKDKSELIGSFYDAANSKYYMLLCKEYSYYTIFERKTRPEALGFSEAVCDIVADIGEVFSIELTEDKSAIEIWIKPKDEETSMVFYLFPYDAGVVYYG